MLSIFRAIIDRVKALFAVSAAQELESELLLRDAERKAELLRQAQRYDDEGLHGIANHLRQQAEAVSMRQPLAMVLPALEHLQADTTSEQPSLPAPASALLPEPASQEQPQVTTPKKKGR